MRLALAAVAFAASALMAASGSAWAGDAVPKHNGADGGNGMPGCGGGTDPAPDGKFYIPGTKRECNPGKQDRAKLR